MCNWLRSSLRRFWVVVGTVSVVTCLQAQAPSGSEVPPPTIRVSTHLVLVDVVVTDKQGKPVSGLHADDFTVEENGKQQKISTFATPEENNATPPALPPGIYSNRAQYRSPGGPITVLLLDAINTPFKDQAYARFQMLKFVKENFKPGERMGVFTLTGGLNVLQDLTSDPQILYTALQHYRPLQNEYTPSSATPPSGPAGVNDSSVAPVSDAASNGGMGARVAPQVAAVEAQLQAFANVSEGYAQEQRIVLTLNALNSLSRILGGLPGRKNIIWVTGDVPLSLIPEDRTVTNAELEEDLPSMDTRRVDQHASGNYAATARTLHAEEIRETAARLSSAQIAIYPVDARGLTLSTDTDSQEEMREMARETGGRAYVNQNEIKIGVERAFEDQTAAYTIGYYPQNKKYDGKYRNIKVKVKKDGVEEQYRRGYFAIDPTQVKGYNAEQAVAQATTDVVPSSLVAFTARVVPPSDNKGKVGLDFLVDASTLSAEDSGNGKHLNVAFYATAFSPDGKMGASLSKKVDQTFDDKTYQQILQHGLLLHMDMDAPPPNSRVHLAVQDGRTGLVGTINAPVGQ
jgi:VWFA-related protein